MKILFVTGSRGEWGYIRPIIKLCIERKIDYEICATNMLLLPNFGNLINEIKSEGFNVGDEIDMALDGYNHYSMAKSLAIFLSSFVDTIKRIKPNWILLAGDRGEQLMASICGAYTYVPTAHIQAGERSGNIDGLARHAIGKFAHIHFASNEDAFRRLISLGEEKFRVFNVGAPQLDEIKMKEFSAKNQLEKKYSICLDKRFILAIFHPLTEDLKNLDNHINKLIKALEKIEHQKIWICPNNDAGSFIVKNKILEMRRTDTHVFENLTRKDFLGFMNNCSCLVGNSSSGLIEAPSFNKPVVNIGKRQNLRIKGKNIIDCGFQSNEIQESINLALSDSFKKKIKRMKNPYGDGNSSRKILDTLIRIKINDKLLTKIVTV